MHDFPGRRPARSAKYSGRRQPGIRSMVHMKSVSHGSTQPLAGRFLTSPNASKSRRPATDSNDGPDRAARWVPWRDVLTPSVLSRSGLCRAVTAGLFAPFKPCRTRVLPRLESCCSLDPTTGSSGGWATSSSRLAVFSLAFLTLGVSLENHVMWLWDSRPPDGFGGRAIGCGDSVCGGAAGRCWGSFWR